MARHAHACLALCCALALAACDGPGDGKEASPERRISDTPSAETFVRAPTEELLERGRRFPAALNVQIIDGTSIGALPPDPAQLDCPPAATFAAFAHETAEPPNCDGYLAASSPLVLKAERVATGFISGLTCPAGCVRSQSTVWRGWMCGHNGSEGTPPTGNAASGMAVSEVRCAPR